jgi:titin
LNWKAPTWYSAYEVTGYQIEQSVDAGDNWAVIVADTGVPQPTYTDTGLTPTNSYMYRVSGINSQGLGAASAPSLDTVAP